MEQYAAKLTEGHKALFKTYPDYKMIVYPTHRSGASPQRIYDATKRNATSAKLVPGGNGVSGHSAACRSRFRRTGWRCSGTTCCATARGRGPRSRPGTHDRRRLVHAGEVQGRVLLPVLQPAMTEAALNNILLYFIQETTAPARLAGEILLVHETLDQSQREAPRLALQPRPAPRAPRAQRGLRQSRHRRRQPAHLRPVRHVQRQPGALRLEAGRQEGNVRPVQRLQAAGRQAQVQGHPAPSSTSTRTSRATSCTASGWWTRR